MAMTLGPESSWLRRGVDEIGKTSVDVFFALSGFLITKLLLDEKTERGRVDLWAFYVRRTLRIWPVYYVALLLGFGGAALLGDRFCRPLGSTCTPELFHVALPWWSAFLGNWVKERLHTPSPIATLWSVCIEEQFYLLFPISFVFARRRHPVFRSVVCGLAVAWSVRIYLGMRGLSVFHNTFGHADNLLAGALVAQLLFAAPERTTRFFASRARLLELGAIAALFLFNEWEVDHVTGVTQWLIFYALSATITATLVGVLAIGRGPVAALLARRPLRYLGQLTYAAYAFHMYGVVIVWAALKRLDLGPWSGGLLRAALAIPMAMGLAWLSRVTFEQRFLRLKERFARTG
jgi:peptidoglycan/LPS O-acetylase OafA/YrhL